MVQFKILSAKVVTSETRYSEMSPIWQPFVYLGKILVQFNLLLGKNYVTLAIFSVGLLFIAANGLIVNKSSNHLVTLVVPSNKIRQLNKNANSPLAFNMRSRDSYNKKQYNCAFVNTDRLFSMIWTGNPTHIPVVSLPGCWGCGPQFGILYPRNVRRQQETKFELKAW